MATYKEIKGVTVQALDDDPVQSGGSWSSGSAINSARSQAAGAGPTQSTAYIIGGSAPGPSISALHEQFDGTSWTEVGDLGTAKYGVATLGTPSSALTAGGYDGAYENDVELWNGSSWTAGTALNTIRGYSGASGVTTAGLVYGGLNPGGGGVQAVTESYNGSSWTETGDLNAGRRGVGQSQNGTTTAAICSGGETPVMANVEQFNGSSWSETTDLNTARSHQWGMGTSTAQLIAGGYPGSGQTAKTEQWDGSTWTEVGDLVNASYANAGQGAGTVTSAIVAAQYTGSRTALSEQWDFPPPTAAILTEGDIFLSGGTTLKGFGKAAGVPSATWASGGNLNTGRDYVAGAAASNSSALIVGGTSNVTESYNGSSWTEVNDMNSPAAIAYARMPMGTATANILAGGGSPYSTNVEQWNGSSWTEIAEINTGKSFGSNSPIGTVTAGIIAGGLVSGGKTATTENWDGSSWTEVSDLNSARGYLAGLGTSTAALMVGGNTPPGSIVALNESWDGSSWTETGDLNTARYRGTAAGTTTLALMYAGANPGPTAKDETEVWNGSSWSELADLSTGRFRGGGGGTASSAIFAGGDPGPGSNSPLTEEWTADNALATVTVS